jgi:Bacterial Ig domain
MMVVAAAVLWVLAVLPPPALAHMYTPGDFSMTPVSGPPGTKVAVTGNAGFETSISVSWDGQTVVSCKSAQDCPDPASPDTGRFLAKFVVPSDASIGEHRVGLSVGCCGTLTSSWTFTVQSTPPSIDSVVADPTPAGSSIKVGGNTGSCSSEATLTLEGTAADPVTVAGGGDGSFAATLTVPRGTFPGTYKLVLGNQCEQQVAYDLRVINHAPVALDDSADTTRDQPVEIPVTANDHDPDGDDGYQQFIGKVEGPAHGSIEIRTDSILYTPAAGFTGVDEFQYSLCEVVGPDGRADCGAATVTVRVRDPSAPSSATTRPAGNGGPGGSGPGGSGPGGSGPGGSGSGSTRPGGGGPGGSGPGVGPTTTTTGSPSTTVQILPSPKSLRVSEPMWLLLAGAAILLTVSALRAARSWRRRSRNRREQQPASPSIQAEPYPGEVQLTVERDATAEPSHTIRLEPRHGPSNQVIEEMVR